MHSMNFGDVEWVEGKRFTLPPASYRHAVTIVCAGKGRHEGKFANGTFPYFALVGFTAGGEGVNIVPVLPDSRLLMIIEERPTVSAWSDAPRVLELPGENIRLGVYQSVEFPAGGVKQGEDPRDGALRELQEETGIENQSVELYRMRPVYPLASDIILRSHYMIAFLSDARFVSRVETDGGLSVLALAEEDVERNIHNGVLADAGTVLIAWNFYQTVQNAKNDSELMKRLIAQGYLSREIARVEGKRNT